jgi:hypothetical protein
MQMYQEGEWNKGSCKGWCHGCGHCCFVGFCWPCASAKARSLYDRSSCLFNLLCVPSCVTRNFIRMGYGIKGSSCGDVCCSVFCPCCSTGQVLSEVKYRNEQASVALVNSLTSATTSSSAASVAATRH